LHLCSEHFFLMQGPPVVHIITCLQRTGTQHQEMGKQSLDGLDVTLAYSICVAKTSTPSSERSSTSTSSSSCLCTQVSNATATQIKACATLGDAGLYARN
jgi:hypothetical protein